MRTLIDSQKISADESAAVLARHGDQHERAYLDVLQNAGRDVTIISGVDELARRATINAMQEGREVICQGVLALGDFAGRSDFLVRVKGTSSLGDYYYEVWDKARSQT